MPEASASVLSLTCFKGRTVLHCSEVARAVGCTTRHIRDLCAEGTLKGAFNVAGDNNRRNGNFWRIPVSAYTHWIKGKTTAPTFPFR